MFEVDFARGFAYQGKNGFIIRVNPQGLYVKKGNKKIFLTQKNSKVMEEECEAI